MGCPTLGDKKKDHLAAVSLKSDHVIDQAAATAAAAFRFLRQPNRPNAAISPYRRSFGSIKLAAAPVAIPAGRSH